MSGNKSNLCGYLFATAHGSGADFKKLESYKVKKTITSVLGLAFLLINMAFAVQTTAAAAVIGQQQTDKMQDDKMSGDKMSGDKMTTGKKKHKKKKKSKSGEKLSGDKMSDGKM